MEDFQILPIADAPIANAPSNTDIGFRGFKTRLDGKLVDAVAIYAGGQTGPQAVAGEEILETVPCDENLPEVVANVIESYSFEQEAREHAAWSDPLFTAADTARLASWHSPRRTVSSINSVIS
ncbi:MAG TPA: hypothetical protein VI431_03220 [Candidatus Acidoferrum sp.]